MRNHFNLFISGKLCIENTQRFYFSFFRLPKLKNMTTHMLSKAVCNLALSYIASGTTSNMQISTTFGKRDLAITNKSTYAFIFQPTQPFMGIYPECIHPAIQKYTLTSLFTTILFIIRKYLKPPTGESLNKLRYFYPKAYHATVKRKRKISKLIQNDLRYI